MNWDDYEPTVTVDVTGAKCAICGHEFDEGSDCVINMARAPEAGVCVSLWVTHYDCLRRAVEQNIEMRALDPNAARH